MVNKVIRLWSPAKPSSGGVPSFTRPTPGRQDRLFPEATFGHFFERPSPKSGDLTSHFCQAMRLTFSIQRFNPVTDRTPQKRTIASKWTGHDGARWADPHQT